MANFFCLLLCLAMFVVAGNGLVCYQCTAQDHESCRTRQSNVTCQPASHLHKSVCLAKETRDEITKEIAILRQCAEVAGHVDVEKDDFAIDLCKSNRPTKVTSCNVCEKSYCNFADVVTPSLACILNVPFMFIFAKYVLQ